MTALEPLSVLVLSISSLLLQAEVEPFKDVENLIKIAIGIFSLVLLALSVSAYRKTRMRKILYAAVAFALFAVQLFLEYLEDAVDYFETPYSNMIFYAITLGILLLFFVAVVKRK